MAKAAEDAELDAAFGFPSEFPYEFDSFGAEPVDSMAGSTETESSDEEEDFFAGLARRLSHATLHDETRKQLTVPIQKSNEAECFQSKEKTQAMAGSPQSTLSGIGGWSSWSDGSPNGSTRVPSPTTTPLSAENDAWDVLSAAAGQVARLKINGGASSFDLLSREPLSAVGGAVGGFPPPIAVENRHTPLFVKQNLSQIQYQQVEKPPLCGSVWGRQAKSTTTWSTQQVQVQNRVRDFAYGYENAKCLRPLPRSPWHTLQVKHQNHQAPFGGSGSRPGLHGGGSGVKRGSAGTGVFLPRQYGAPPPESRKKANCAPVQVPAKVIHALNMNLDELNAARQPRFSGDLGVDFDALIARRNALLMQQRLRLRREEAANYEARLPQDWTY